MLQPKQPAIYIMASQRNGTLYTGVTANLPQRTHHHQTAKTGFTAQYNCHTLVYYELHPTMESAITREKQIKAGPRAKKLALIEKTNPTWKDLTPEIL